MSRLLHLLDDIEQVQGVLADTRVDARDSVAMAIFELQRKLKSALGQHVLKGAPNLAAGGASEPFYAWRLRGKYLSEPLPHDGREILVVTMFGEFAMAKRDLESYDGTQMQIVARDATSLDVTAQDVHEVFPNMLRILSKHLELAKRSCERYEYMSDLSDRIRAALNVA